MKSLLGIETPDYEPGNSLTDGSKIMKSLLGIETYLGSLCKNGHGFGSSKIMKSLLGIETWNTTHRMVKKSVPKS